jgi:hypothetical protein
MISKPLPDIPVTKQKRLPPRPLNIQKPIDTSDFHGHSHKLSLLPVPPKSPNRIQRNYHHHLKLQEEEEELIRHHRFGIMMMMNHTESASKASSLNVDEAVQSFINEDLSMLDSFGQIESTNTFSQSLKPSPNLSSSTNTSPDLNTITPTSSLTTDSTTNTSPASSVEHTSPRLKKYPSIAGRLRSHFNKRTPSNPTPSNSFKVYRSATTPTPSIQMTFGSEKSNN